MGDEPGISHKMRSLSRWFKSVLFVIPEIRPFRLGFADVARWFPKWNRGATPIFGSCAEDGHLPSDPHFLKWEHVLPHQRGPCLAANFGVSKVGRALIDLIWWAHPTLHSLKSRLLRLEPCKWHKEKDILMLSLFREDDVGNSWPYTSSDLYFLR